MKKVGKSHAPPHLLFDTGQWRGLQCRQFDEFVYGCAQSIGILAAGCGKVGLSAAAALNQLGCFADDLAYVHAVCLHHIVRSRSRQHGFAFV